MSEWKEYTLGELTTDGKGTYGIAASAVDYCAELPTYLRITDINDDGTIDFNGLKSVDDPNSSKYVLQENDIVFARTGASTGRSYFYDRRDGKFVYAGFLIKFSLDPKKVNPRILKYYTHSKVYYNWVHSFENGATRGNINAKTFADMKLLLPPRNVQDSIASILSSFDDKIAINRRICENLEAQAQALFKHWFIDFAPFKEGKFVDSELGMIPEGWRVGKLEEICVFQNGHAFKSKEFSDSGKYKLITIKGVQDGRLSIDGAVNIENVPSNMKNHCFLKEKDILLSLTGNVGRVCFVDQPNLLLNQRVAKIVPISEEYWGFLYTFMRRKTTQNEMINLAKGTAQANLSPIETAQFKIALPAQEVVSDFSKVVNIMYQKMILLKQESSRLSSLRDTLLPKLMSGEIKV